MTRFGESRFTVGSNSKSAQKAFADDPKTLGPVRATAMHLELPRAFAANRAKVPDYIPHPYPEVNTPKFCRSGIEKAGKAALRDCHVELLFVGDQLSQRLNVPAGPYLQVCKSFGKPGALIPVKDHAQASKMSKSFCACRKKKGTIESCKVETQELVRTGEFGRGRHSR